MAEESRLGCPILKRTPPNRLASRRINVRLESLVDPRTVLGVRVAAGDLEGFLLESHFGAESDVELTACAGRCPRIP
jgi:hypothetical protein